MVESLASGSCIAMEITGSDSDVVEKFRELCGPSDPAVAKLLRPNSIRARFGTNKVNNAVHCTDLPEDGTLEVEFFFNVLQQNQQ